MTEAAARVKLAWHMRLELSPKPPGTKPPSLRGTKQHGNRAVTLPAPGVPAPTASSTARLGISIKDSTRQPSEQPLATLVLTFRVQRWLDPPQAPCQALWKAAPGGVVWP